MGSSGLELLERLKQMKPEVSLFVISERNDPEFVFRASKAGADEYLGKPID